MTETDMRHGQYSGQETLIKKVNGGTVPVTNLILISLNLFTQEHWKQENNHLCMASYELNRNGQYSG